MNWTSKPFFIYCLIASLFLTLSGIGIYMQSGNIAPLLLSLPMSGFFVYYVVRLLIYKQALPQGPQSSHADVIIVIVLVALIAGSTYTMMTKKRPQQHAPQQSTATQLTPSPTRSPVKKGRITTEDRSPVRVRKLPSTTSAILTTEPFGTTFALISEKGEWIEIQLQSGQKGWIKKEFTTLDEKKSK